MARKSTKEGGAVKRRVIMVELKVPMDNTPEVTFFGSKKALFEYFGDKALGMTFKTSYTKNFEKEIFENSICRIYQAGVMTDHCPEIVERRSREGRTEIHRENNDNFDWVEAIKEKNKEG